ncbi:glutamate ABC transporter substrate-binding protein [Frankia sp. Ag45/Mut15]|uniref:Glutamate ABC transporter substrate-binding protein n=1 Tax=Frankia umida TaxID=573489 RepID=A0ABT0K2E8_9ACTN|nr:glutamate ABC transporter substrate-binding protein [Frankia umida]MCK9877473.1 glutamate ABC transporter substrate-binding protein [Frankia umida]
MSAPSDAPPIAPSVETSRRRPARARVPAGRVPLTVLLLLGLLLGLAGCGTARRPLPIEAGPLPASPAPAGPDEQMGPPDPGGPGPAAGADTGMGGGAGAGTGGGAGANGGATRPDGTCQADGRPVRSSEPPLTPLPPPGRMPAGSRLRTIAHDRGYLRIGIVTDAPPAGLMNWRTLRLEGFDVGIARAVAAAVFGPTDVDSHIQFRAVTTTDREDLLRSNMVDMLVATMTITCERKRQVRFSSVYYEATLRLLVRQDSGITGLAALAGRPVCTSAGSTAGEKLTRRPPAQAPKVVTLPRLADCLVALQYGDVDAIVGDDVLLAGLAAQDPYTTVLGPEAFGPAFAADGGLDEPYGIAMPITGDSADDDLFVSFVNGVLRSIMVDGTWSRLYDEWLRPGLRVAGQPPLGGLGAAAR